MQFKLDSWKWVDQLLQATPQLENFHIKCTVYQRKLTVQLMAWKVQGSNSTTTFRTMGVAGPTDTLLSPAVTPIFGAVSTQLSASSVSLQDVSLFGGAGIHFKPQLHAWCGFHYWCMVPHVMLQAQKWTGSRQDQEQGLQWQVGTSA